MAEKFTFKVLRQMDGDKQYFEGDTREMTEAEAKHLVSLGVLEKVGEAKSEPAPQNKAEEARANKAEAAPAKKSRKG